MRNWRFPIIGSLLVHALLFVSFPSGGSGERGYGNRQTGVDAVQVKIENIVPKKPAIGMSKDPCSDWFGGIGITVGSGALGPYVAHVYSGYPAERAGIQNGDLIVSDWHDIRGDPGTSATLQLKRGERTFSLTMIREKVCTSD